MLPGWVSIRRGSGAGLAGIFAEVVMVTGVDEVIGGVSGRFELVESDGFVFTGNGTRIRFVNATGWPEALLGISWMRLLPDWETDWVGAWVSEGIKRQTAAGGSEMPIVGPMPGEPDDPTSYYDGIDPVPSPPSAPTSPIAEPVGVGVGLTLVTMSALIARFGRAAMAPLIAALRRIGIPIGGTMRWASIPTVVRVILVSLGITEAVDFVFDTDGEGEDFGLVPLPIHRLFGDGALSPGETIFINNRTYTVASHWVANSIIFYRFQSGHQGVRNKHGVWKIWKPKKPIVLYRTGADDLKTLVAADMAIEKQAKKVAKVLTRRGFVVRRKTEGSK